MAFEKEVADLVASDSFQADTKSRFEARREELNLPVESVAEELDQLNKIDRLVRLRDNPLPNIDDCSLILLKKNEIVHYVAQVGLAEPKRTTRYVGGSSGVSVRIMKGVSYRVGSYKGERITEEHIAAIDYGDLVITNKRIVFSGNKKTVTYNFRSLIDFTIYSDAVQFQKENEAKPKYFLHDDMFVKREIGIVVDRVLLESD